MKRILLFALLLATGNRMNAATHNFTVVNNTDFNINVTMYATGCGGLFQFNQWYIPTVWGGWGTPNILTTTPCSLETSVGVSNPCTPPTSLCSVIPSGYAWDHADVQILNYIGCWPSYSGTSTVGNPLSSFPAAASTGVGCSGFHIDMTWNATNDTLWVIQY